MDSAQPDPRQLESLAERFVAENTVMVLATADDQRPWAAAVYYVYRQGGFCFFSAPDSCHIQQAQATHRAAAAIFAYGTSWQQIRGIQMSGRIERIGPGAAAARVITDYLRKFSFSLDFFSSGADIGLEAFANRFKVHLYRFQPSEIYYLDNSIRFGFRQRVFLHPILNLRGGKNDEK
jgi:uncharacterized protein YhbP (UPF0306 family)